MTWHADATLLDRYASGEIDHARASSLEAHLLACAECRTAVAGRVDNDRLAATWHEMEEVLDAPRPGLVERLLLRLGVAEHLARLLVSTPALRLSWLVGLSVALGFAVLASHAGQGEAGMLVFLLVAPLLPVAGVAVAFAPGIDPAYEIALAAPMASFRLLLVRSAAVMASTAALAGAAALALPDIGWVVVAWVLPALGLSALSLALSSFVAPLPSAAAVASVWVVGVLGSELAAARRLGTPLGIGQLHSLAFDPAGQLCFAVLAAVAALVIAGRRDVYELGRTP
ncbi:MAG: zf-HC2 domain-containing protein [Actinobacteria bacterium]|nr:zf-HC2 domain-containing protein [Actinomycetota bacterium]